eukprot:GHVR01140183.1.p1 GENE.GHVR01140183.1~~GHVR01140183.1.p1  ORF type:complete len:159 (+),score=29.72 GHVR01140183.1:143-619(+)
MVVCPQNQPLCIRCFGNEDELSMHFAVYCSIDYIEEKMQENAQSDPYLGYLCQGMSAPPSVPDPRTSPAVAWELSEYRIYGYAVATGVKFVCVLLDKEVSGGDSAIKSLFKQMHKLYADTLSNPFVGGSLDNPKFQLSLAKIAEHHARILAGQIPPPS